MKERNKCLDFCKGIAAFGIVFTHIQFPGSFGKIMSAVGSCGIVLFFLISGYSAYGTSEEMCPKLLKRFRRNLLVTLIAAAVYFAVAFYTESASSGTLRGWLRGFRSPKFYLRLFLLGDLERIYGDPLWFLIALLYAYLIFWCMYKLRLQRFAKYAMPPLIVMRIVMEAYKYAKDADWRICSNVLVAALPLMLLGFCIAEQKEKLLAVKAGVWAAACIGSLAATFLLVVFDPFKYNISQIPKMAAGAFALLFSLKKPEMPVCKAISRIGGAYSLHVYLWHMPLIVLLYHCFETHTVSQRFLSWGMPVLVAALAVLLAAVIVGAGQVFRKKKPQTAA